MIQEYLLVAVTLGWPHGRGTTSSKIEAGSTYTQDVEQGACERVSFDGSVKRSVALCLWQLRRKERLAKVLRLRQVVVEESL
jgi:hypothetical protein